MVDQPIEVIKRMMKDWSLFNFHIKQACELLDKQQESGDNLEQLKKRKAELEQELENQKKTEQNRKNRQAQKENKRLA